jgi:hypothetical protein
MFDFFLAALSSALSLAPLGLLLLFWRVFPRDRDFHPIYRESGIETTDKRTKVKDATARGLHMRDVERKGKSSLSTDRLSGSSLYRFSFFDLGSSRAIESIVFKKSKWKNKLAKGVRA